MFGSPPAWPNSTASVPRNRSCPDQLSEHLGPTAIVSAVLQCAIIDLRSTPDHPLGGALETFIRREDAERFIEEVRGDDPELASYLRMEERGLVGGRAQGAERMPGPLGAQPDDDVTASRPGTFP